MLKNNKLTSKSYNDILPDNKIMYSDEHIKGAEICSNYIKGKCLENGKYCDGCAFTYNNKDY